MIYFHANYYERRSYGLCCYAFENWRFVEQKPENKKKKKQQFHNRLVPCRRRLPQPTKPTPIHTFHKLSTNICARTDIPILLLNAFFFIVSLKRLK